MIRPLLLVATLISLTWMPWPVTVVCMILSSIFMPLSGIVFGVIADLFYAPYGSTFLPYGLLWGVAASGVGFIVERFIRTRIMGA